jgi:hypothetical protein
MPDIYTGPQSLTKLTAGVINDPKITPRAQVPVNLGTGIFEHVTTITNSYCITTGSGGLSAGPIKILDGVVVRIPDGSSWTIR